MPVVASWDGVNREITLDNSVANGTWSPLDLYKEYLAYRRDNHQFRGFEPLVIMKGGEPKGGGKFAPRFLQMLTDSRSITTKLILPNVGPYRTTIDGEIATDNPDVDPEPFNISNLTTGVIIDYKPAEAEIIQVSGGSGLSAGQAAKLDRIHALLDVIEGDLDHAEMLRLIGAAVLGKASGAGTTEMRFRDTTDSIDRIIATVDEIGNRSDVTLDAS